MIGTKRLWIYITSLCSSKATHNHGWQSQDNTYCMIILLKSSGVKPAQSFHIYAYLCTDLCLISEGKRSLFENNNLRLLSLLPQDHLAEVTECQSSTYLAIVFQTGWQSSHMYEYSIAGYIVYNLIWMVSAESSDLVLLTHTICFLRTFLRNFIWFIFRQVGPHAT